MRDIKEAKAMLAKMPRTQLGFFPTPLYRLDRMSEELGVNLWVKRDDFTGSNLFGGNKTRKLEFLIGKALADGDEYVLTYGATQSNHAMQTTWAAVKNGLKPVLYLAAVVPPDKEDFKANLLLDKIYGAEIHIVDLQDGETFEDAEYRSFDLGREHIQKLEAEGKKCMEIPMGGANEYGSLGYVNAMVELAEQMEAAGVHFDHMYHSTGSGGTMAGITAGKKLLGMDMMVHSVSAMSVGEADSGAGEQDGSAGYRAGAAELANGALALIGEDALVTADDFFVDQNHYAPGYEMPSEEANAAIRMLAEKEGILTDPVYSGKAFSGLVSDVRNGRIAQGSDVLFLHTGGATVFFAEKEILGSLGE